MSSIIKNIIVVVGLLALAGIGYYLFVIERSANISTIDTTAAYGEIETANFLRRLEELQQIQISTAIFSDPRFRSLEDFQTEPESVPVGRNNPFAN